jgi:uncharacterized Zn finger protein
VSSLRELVTSKALRLRAGDRTFVRGREYVDEGRVADLAGDGAVITATVVGTRDYGVVLAVGDDGLVGTCDCPTGETGVFCKHLVALGLAWIGQAGERRSAGSRPPAQAQARPRRITTEDIRGHLAALDHDALVDLVLAQAERDDPLRERLMLLVATAEADGGGAELVRRAIDQAVRLPGYLRYADVFGYVSGIHDAVDLLDDLLRAGQVNAVIDLAEHALRHVEGALDHVDDSDGLMGDVLGRLGDLHLAACEAAGPDPVALAGRLFAWELDGEWDVFSGAALAYGGVLGEAGLSEYRRRAEAVWAGVPTLGPTSGPSRSFEGRRFRITMIMESLARASGDIDELLAIKARDLSSPYAFLEIARVCVDAGRADEAVEWAEQGVRAFPDTPDTRLREFVADCYHERGRHDTAIELVWAPFEAVPTVEGFATLRAHASRAGAWPVWRTRALETARASTVESQRPARPPAHRWDIPGDGSALVRMLLLEGDIDTAWQDAVSLGCSEPVWRELARRRETNHPEDAIPIHQREVEALLRTTTNDGYAAAVELLGHIRELMAKIGAGDQFPGYLAGVRAAHARKRNFTRMLDAARW